MPDTQTRMRQLEQLVESMVVAPLPDLPMLVGQATRLLDPLIAKTDGRSSKAYLHQKLVAVRVHILGMSDTTGAEGESRIAHAQAVSDALAIAKNLNWA